MKQYIIKRLTSWKPNYLKLIDSGHNAATLTNKIAYRETVTAILLMIPAASTTMLTYYGVSIPLTEQGGDLVSKGQALAFSITIGVFSWMGWFYLFGLIYRMRQLRLTASLIAGVAYVGILAAVDMPFNALALAGGSAVQLTMADTAHHYEALKTNVTRQSTIASRLLPALEAQAQRFAKLEQDEIDFGTFSGRRGPGKVSAGFGQIAGLLRTLIDELKSGLQQTKPVREQIVSTFKQIKSQAYRQGPIRPRVENISVTADRLDDLLVELGQYDFQVSISATLISLKAIFPSPTEASSAFERTQNAELSVISDMAKPVADALQTALDGLRDDIDAVSAKSVRPLGAMAAIHAKWTDILAQWMAALFVDIGPSALLIMLIAGFREAETRAREVQSSNELQNKNNRG